MARTIKGNELAIQSYIFTTAKYDFNAYEKRQRLISAPDGVEERNTLRT